MSEDTQRRIEELERELAELKKNQAVPEIVEQVKTWAWNYSIFDIYDEIKTESEYIQTELLNEAMRQMTTQDSKDALISLAYQLGVEIDGQD